jgi:protein-S-isoprenylcysteine O-methyltransferase Ste14
MIWWLGYVVLLAVLFVRIRTPDSAPPAPLHPAPDEPLRLVAIHHATFYALLLGAPLEALIRGGATRGRMLGLLLFATGVWTYRSPGRALGDSLSPLVTPRPGAELVTQVPYRYLRHPMYVGQALIAVGAPLTLGCRWMLWLALPAVAILVLRAGFEDAALARTFPEHGRWAARAKRLIPFVF